MWTILVAVALITGEVQRIEVVVRAVDKAECMKVAEKAAKLVIQRRPTEILGIGTWCTPYVEPLPGVDT